MKGNRKLPLSPPQSIRERTEQIELELLSPHAAKSALSRGRPLPEKPDPIRTCYQRDRDRVLHCKAFRRLKHKTQVFIDPDGDHFRTRLTHTLEVSQISRTVARALRLNEDLTEAIALGHDLGHPPFGHAGEEALNDAMQEVDPTLSFRHFEQSVRVVQVLERDGAGLNLTYETLEGIGGHSKGRDDLAHASRVPVGSMEAEVVRTCDRVAYLNHDLDDAFRAGHILPNELPVTVSEGLGIGNSERITRMVTDIIQATGDGPHVLMSRQMEGLLNELKEFMFERLYVNNPRTAPDIERAKEMLRLLFRHYLDHPELLPERHLPTDLAQLPQAVCDYIAGMTDRYAVQQFESLFLPKVWRRVE
ncbi:MAG: deoxyguanosinetriphosphate triphosphohydrolase [Fimbriimonadia bacterium]